MTNRKREIRDKIWAIRDEVEKAEKILSQAGAYLDETEDGVDEATEQLDDFIDQCGNVLVGKAEEAQAELSELPPSDGGLKNFRKDFFRLGSEWRRLEAVVRESETTGLSEGITAALFKLHHKAGKIYDAIDPNDYTYNKEDNDDC